MNASTFLFFLLQMRSEKNSEIEYTKKEKPSKRSLCMSKKNKKIEVEIKETANNKKGFIELSLSAGKQEIGLIQQEEGKSVTVITYSGAESKAKSVDEGINQLLMDYNLHHM